jgi:prepilin-type N-terminal cleavage/methylation domain-containing protein
MKAGFQRVPMKSTRENGFTFIEITMVVIVVGLMAALAVHPMKNYLRRLEFKNSSQNIKRLIQTAQSKAMANPNVHIGVYFDMSKTPHRVILFQDKVNPTTYQYDGAGDPNYLQPEVLPVGSSLKPLYGFPDEIVFRGDGSAWKSQKIVITNGTFSDTLDVLASTGRVRMGK